MISDDTCSWGKTYQQIFDPLRNDKKIEPSFELMKLDNLLQ